MFWIVRSIILLAERMNWATSSTPFVIFDVVKTFVRPSSTSFFMYICRLVESFSSIETSLGSEVEMLGAVLASRTFVRVLT